MGLITNSTKVNLDNNNLSQIPSEIFSYRNLQKLNLRSNNIQTISKDISKLKRLRMLDLSDNKINLLYARLFDLHKLETLILNNNRIKSLPYQIGQLKNLRKLCISGNNLSSLPSQIEKLTNLEVLNISNNPLAEFPLEILNLKRLKSLRISNINLTTFPVEKILTELPALKYLYCYSTHLNNIRNKETNKDYSFLASYKGNSLLGLKEIAKLTLGSQFTIPRIKDTSVMSNHKEKSKFRTKHSATKQTVSKTEKTDNRNIIFICYSHKDDRWRKRVETAIKTMMLEGIQVTTWSDRKIKTGSQWQNNIFDILSKSKIAILLISNDFLASEFIKDKELPKILEKAKNEELTIMSIILSFCRYTENQDLSKYQSLNPPDLPFNKLPRYKQDLYLLNLTKDIEYYIK